MKVTVTKLEKSQVELVVEVPFSDMGTFLDGAAQRLSTDVKFPGFRPGKAPRELVEKKIGAQALLEEAANLGIPRFYTDAVLQEKIEAVGTPEISVSKVAPQNDFVFKAIVGVMPVITLPDYKTVKVKKNAAKESPEEIEKTVQYLRKSRAQYNEVDRGAQKTDRVTVDFDMFLSKVPLEDGQYKDHPIMMGEEQIVKGFEDKLLGTKKGETKEFMLKFPKDHFKKEIAGKEIDFKVTIKKVEEVKLPELNDEFAKSLGQFNSVDELRKKIGENITREDTQKENERVEKEILEKIAKDTKVEIPQAIIDSEIRKMIGELRQNVQSIGGKFEDYLASMKKSLDDLKKDLTKQAEERAKIALIIREIAKREDFKVEPKEIEDEINAILLQEVGNPDIKKQVTSLEFKEYVHAIIRNRKVLDMLVKNATT